MKAHSEIIPLGSESLGVRGLSCFVEVDGFKVLIDPGVALGFSRWGLHPHPLQAVAGDIVRSEIINLWSDVDAVILSHLHGDHTPLYNANPFQLSLNSLGDLKADSTLYVISERYVRSSREKLRLHEIVRKYGLKVKFVSTSLSNAEHLTFSLPYPHGSSGNTYVMLTLIVGDNLRFVHASDTQLLSREVAEVIKSMRPDIVMTDGPPIYRYLNDPSFVRVMLKKAEENLRIISEQAGVIIVDHHINRCNKGLEWVKGINRKITDTEVITAAEYMHKQPVLLEGWRRTLYRALPFRNDWFKPFESYKAVMNAVRKPGEKMLNDVFKVKGLNEGRMFNILKRRGAELLVDVPEEYLLL